MIFDPIGYSKRRRIFIDKLKRQSDYYPQLVIVNEPDFDDGKTPVTYVSTLVRVQAEDGKWWKIHCVQSTVLNAVTTLPDLLMKAMREFHMVKHLYIVGPDIHGTEIDECQLTERERLMELHEKVLKKG